MTTSGVPVRFAEAGCGRPENAAEDRGPCERHGGVGDYAVEERHPAGKRSPAPPLNRKAHGRLFRHLLLRVAKVECEA